MDWTTIAGLIARHVMTTLAGALVTLGLLQASDQNNFISIATGIIVGALGLAWSWWQKRGQKAMEGEVSYLRARLAARQTSAVIAFLALALAALVLAGSSAQAQTRKAAPLTGDPVRDIGSAIKDGQGSQSRQPQANPLDELARKIAALSLADFKYAAALAHATGNNVTAPCWDEWVKLISAQQQPLVDPATNQPMQEPDPHLATDMERLSEAIHQLQPNSELSVACAPMASAVQRDAATLISGVLSGGALGLFKLPIPIGVVP